MRDAAPIIAQLLRSTDEAIRSSAAEALGYLGVGEPSHYGKALLPLLHDAVSLVRSCAAESLGALGYEPAIGDLGRLLTSDPVDLVRTSAAEALAAFEGRQVLAFAQRGLDDSEPTVRAYSAQVIGRNGDSRFLQTLDDRLATETAFQPRAAILGARYLLGSSADLPRLLGLLDGADLDQSTIVLNVLSEAIAAAPASAIIGDASSIRTALSRVKERDSLLGRQADKLLKQLAARLGASPN